MGSFDWQAEENAWHTDGMRGYLLSVCRSGALNVAFRRPMAASAQQAWALEQRVQAVFQLEPVWCVETDADQRLGQGRYAECLVRQTQVLSPSCHSLREKGQPFHGNADLRCCFIVATLIPQQSLASG